jgi:hypothetical protein
MALFARARKSSNHRWRVISALMAGLAFALMLTVSTAGQAHAATLLSQGKPTTASSIENAGTPAAAATDGNTGTRWSSAFSDPQWLQVDLHDQPGRAAVGDRLRQGVPGPGIT